MTSVLAIGLIKFILRIYLGSTTLERILMKMQLPLTFQMQIRTQMDTQFVYVKW